MSLTTASPIGHPVHSFEMYPTSMVSRSTFNRSHNLITTMDDGYLVPIWHDEAVPGDTLKLDISTLTRLATQIVPFMDHVYMDVHVWAVPYRLVWSHWKNFMGEQPAKYDPSNPLAGTDYLTPQLTTTTGGVSAGSIYDYFDIPLGVAGVSFNSFLFRAYNLVWNEWYRSELLQDPVVVRLGDNGVDQLTDFTLLKRGKRKDYFTGALPTPQKGPAVDLPLGTEAPVKFNTNASDPYFRSQFLTSPTIFDSNGDPFATGASGTRNNLALSGTSNLVVSNQTVSNPVSQGSAYFSAYADLTSATAATINSLRQAFAIQRVFEKDNRGGTRYIEMILSHFGVKSPDDRQQRPEFLGGGTFNLNLSVVPQTSSTNSTTPQGNLSSYGVINGTTKTIVKSFTEHTLLFAVASIRTDLTYQQGLHRNYSRRSRFDYYLPATANLGEQAILNKEIYSQGSSVVNAAGDPVDDDVFGYQERWAEMRYKGNRVTGLTRSTASLSLDIWHLAQDFSSLPTLNSEFIEVNDPIDRVIAVSGEGTAQFLCNFYFNETWVRPMPVYSIPSMSSHF